MVQQERTLKVFQDVINERLASSTGQSPVSSGTFDAEIDALVVRIASARDRGTSGSENAKQLRQLALTLSDLRDSADRFDARIDSRDQKLRELSARVGNALATLDKNRLRASRALGNASAELDQRVLAYVDAEAERMIVALEKAEQQIAHLYEYLALQNLDRSAP
jgi:predicted  nucleic acid-binding Zn-ribbon protein